MTGSESLRAWRASAGLSLQRAGELFGCSSTAVWDYERGAKMPRIDYAQRIEAATSGAVTVASWASAEGGKCGER